MFYFCNVEEQTKAAGKADDRVKRSPFVPKFIGKRDDLNEDALQSLEAAIRDELILGHEPYDSYPSDNDDDEFEREARMNRQLFVGKRDSNPLGKRTGPIVGYKRYPPQVGYKRYSPIVGSPLLLPDEISDLEAEKRGMHPMFVGKRRAPFFVGKRRMHLVVGRGGNMNNPKLVGKRGQPLFVGRRRADADDKPIYYSYIALRRSVPDELRTRDTIADSLLNSDTSYSSAEIGSGGLLENPEETLSNSSNQKSKRFEIPVFIGKRYVLADLASAKQAHSHTLQKRFEPPMFVGKRSVQQNLALMTQYQQGPLS